MDKLFVDVKNLVHGNKAVTDSFIFRLHYRLTFVILITFSILVTGRQYIGDPIDCISKDDIPRDLLDTYCWIHTTFSVDHAWHKKVGIEIPYPGVDKFLSGENRVYHAYYQWVCFVLFLQALLFYIPRYFWKHIESRRMLNLSKGSTNLVADYLYNNLGNHKVYVSSYIIAEVLNFANVVGQIYLMDLFLGGEFLTYGSKVLSFNDWDWRVRHDPMIRVFPRMTKCTFHRYGSSGDVQKHDAMCLLPINIINEKIYVFLWFWFVILALLTAIELLYRAVTLLIPRVRLFVLRRKSRHIDINHLVITVRYTSWDDWFVLSFISRNLDSFDFENLITKFADRIKEGRFGEIRVK